MADEWTIHHTDATFHAAMEGDREPLSFVLRGAIYIEHALIAFIESRVEYPRALDNARLSYAQRIEVALALGLPPTLGPPLRKVGSIRNKFAHQPETILTEADITALYDDFQKFEKIPLAELYNLSLGRDKFVYEKASVMDRFIFLAHFLRSYIFLRAKYTSDGDQLNEAPGP